MNQAKSKSKDNNNNKGEEDIHEKKYGPLYTGPSLDVRYMNAMIAVGPRCPVCYGMWSAVEKFYNPIRDMIEVKVECSPEFGKCGGKTHHLVYHDDTKELELEWSDGKRKKERRKV